MKQVGVIISGFLLLFLGACNTVKYLKPGEDLYAGAKIFVDSKEPVNKKAIIKELEKILRPKPNQTIVGVRFKLWFYDIAGPHPKGIKKMLKNVGGEPPVFFNPQSPPTLADIMVNRLNNMGYFVAAVNYSTITKSHQVMVTYTATVSKPYTIRQVQFPDSTNLLNTKISESQTATLLKKGIQYDLDLIKAERLRIDAFLKNEGFYYFNADYLLFQADSTVGNKSVALRLSVKEDIADKSRRPYYINRVYIFPSGPRRDSSIGKADTLLVDGYEYVNADSSIRAKALLRSVFIKPGDVYSRKNYNMTLSRLMGMNLFRVVNIKYKDTVSDGQGRLNVFITMSPLAKRSIQLELEAVTKSNNYTGPGATLSLKNRNLFRGGELLQVNLNGNFETQFTGIQKGFNSYELGANTQLYLQRFLAPAGIRNGASKFVPRTKFDLGFRTLDRVLYFSMNAVNFSYGYTWKQTKEIEHTFNPLAINFAKLEHTTQAFKDLLADNPFLEKSFQEQFTVGGNYAFTYNSLAGSVRRNQYYFNGMIDLSGNLPSLAQRLVTGHSPSPENPQTIFGYTYSQYTKFSTDTRYAFTINKNSKIATRLIAGAGIPYGNSTAMPYVKQFFSGGSNSIRAFLPRSVGPGTYRVPDSLFNKTFLDKSGDIKLEGSIEYRFTIISALKGAVFLDAGNVWLMYKNEGLPGGEFELTQFYKQLAVGTGFGLRLDLSFFILRFDLGMPLRKPYLPDDQRWVIHQIDFGSGSWRSQNLVLNIAIGYPF